MSAEGISPSFPCTRKTTHLHICFLPCPSAHPVPCCVILINPHILVIQSLEEWRSISLPSKTPLLVFLSGWRKFWPWGCAQIWHHSPGKRSVLPGKNHSVSLLLYTHTHTFPFLWHWQLEVGPWSSFTPDGWEHWVGRRAGENLDQGQRPGL